MNRRRFLQCAATGLFVPSAFAVTPQQRAVILSQRQPTPASALVAITSWFDALDPASSNGDFSGSSDRADGAPITVTETGLITRCRMYVSSWLISQTFKFGVYNSSTDALLGSCSIVATATGWMYGTLSSSISNSGSTTYNLMLMAPDTFVKIARLDGLADGTRKYKTSLAYADMPYATMATIQTDTTQKLSIGLGGNT